MRRRSILLIVALFAAACGGGDDEGDAARDTTTTTTADPDAVVAAAASYDLAVGPPARFVVGLFNPDRGQVGYGTAELAFVYLGDGQQGGGSAAPAPRPGPAVTARYLPLPGSADPPAGADQPAFLASSERGVYAAEVAFDKPGFWQVAVTVALEDGPRTATSAFPVLPAHEVPFPGDAAISVENLTVADPGPSPEAVDSRAQEGRPVPDPELHGTTVAAALAAGRPVLLTISTPTFCVSQFCGPVTDMIAELAGRYGERAAFIHIEVWQDFEAEILNPAAQAWIAKGKNVNEPWVFLIGADGKVTARWDNVATQGEIEPLLQAL